MVYSSCDRFTFEIINCETRQPYKEIAQNKKVFIIVEKGQEFTFHLKSCDNLHYGVKIFIDGQPINKKYTL